MKMKKKGINSPISVDLQLDGERLNMFENNKTFRRKIHLKVMVIINILTSLYLCFLNFWWHLVALILGSMKSAYSTLENPR